MGGKELAPPCRFDFVFCERGSNTFAADPPAPLDLRRVCKGKKFKNQGGDDWAVCVLGRGHARGSSPIAKHSIWFATAAHCQTGFDFVPLTATPKIESAGWISGKGV
jgi:hypothetical protein